MRLRDKILFLIKQGCIIIDGSLVLLETTQETTQEQILKLIYTNPSITRNEISEKLGNITADGVKYHLDKMKESGVIQRIGSTKNGKWIIQKDGE